MPKWLKISSLVSALVILLFTGIMAYITTLLKVEDIKKDVLGFTSKELPGARLDFEQLSIYVGLKSKLKFEGIKLQLKDQGVNKELLSIDKLDVKIPFWSFLFGTGTVKAYIDSAYVTYQSFDEKESNWKRAKKGELLGLLVATKDSNKPTTSHGWVLPLTSRFDIEFGNSTFNYISRFNKNYTLKPKKILLKDISIYKPFAYEIMINSKKIQPGDFWELIAVGQVDLSKLDHKKIAQTSYILKAKKRSPTSRWNNLFDFKVEGKSQLKVMKNIETEMSIQLGEFAKAESKLNFHDFKRLEVDLKGSASLIDLLGRSASRFLEGVKKNITDPAPLMFDAKFDIAYGRETRLENTKVSFRTDRPIKGVLENEDFEMNVSGKMDADGFARLKIEGNTLKGLYTTSLKGRLGRRNLKRIKELASVDPLGIFYLTYFHTDLKSLHLKDYIVDLNADVELANGKIKSKGIEFAVDDGTGKISANGPYSSGFFDIDFSLETQRLPLSFANFFIPTKWAFSGGDIDSKSHGKLKADDGKIKYVIEHNSLLRNFGFKSFDFYSHLYEPLKKMKSLGRLNLKEASKVSQLESLLTITGEKVIIHKASGSIEGGELDFQGDGSLFLSNQSDEQSLLNLELVYNDDAFQKFMQKDFNTTKIPVRFTGQGTQLKLDMLHTAKELGRKTIQLKAIEKLKKMLFSKDGAEYLESSFREQNKQ